MTTVVTTASAQAITIMSVSLQSESLRHSSFLNQMSGPMPSQAMATAKREKQQTTPHMPIVQIMDLQKNAGDEVTMDLFHTIHGRPAIGDEKIEGRGLNLSFASMKMVINQTRQAVSPGGNMSQKRTAHNLRSIGRANLADWFARYNEQWMQVHMAGARGSDDAIDWEVPLETDSRFGIESINTVLPPTDNRYFIAGGGTSVADISKTDALTLEDIDTIASVLREQPLPPAPIKVEKDLEMNERPLYCLIMTERQWHYIETQAGQNNWRKFVADASTRYHITKHPLFLGTTAMWNGIILKRMSRPIRFHGGDTVKYTESSTGNVISRTVAADIDTTNQGEAVDRAILLGGQALAVAWGNAGNPSGPFPMKWSEILQDHGNAMELCGGQMGGFKKIRYAQSDGKLTDFGVCVVDSYAPAQDSAAGEALRTALRTG